jgi:hypothetical protein
MELKVVVDRAHRGVLSWVRTVISDPGGTALPRSHAELAQKCRTQAAAGDLGDLAIEDHV